MTSTRRRWAVNIADLTLPRPYLLPAEELRSQAIETSLLDAYSLAVERLRQGQIQGSAVVVIDEGR